MRLKVIAVLGASLALLPAATAHAGTLTTQNSCRFSLDQIWRHLAVDLSGIASPSPVAPGSGVALTQASGRTVIPAYLMQYAANAGILSEGVNEIPTKVWVALAAPETPQGVQVVNVDATARTTVTNGRGVTDGRHDPAAGHRLDGGDERRSASGRRRSDICRACRSARAVPTCSRVGSIFIHARPGSGGFFLNIDCQPGSGEGPEPAHARPPPGRSRRSRSRWARR